jgi:hypothetical protein
MRRLLLILNLLLTLALAAGVWKWRDNDRQARRRERELLALRYAPLSMPIPQLSARTEAALPANYLQVAQQMLFAPDRNPNRIVPPPPPPPPPPPEPVFPSLHGVMSFMGPVQVILTHPKAANQKRYAEGDTIGEFRIKALDNQRIVLTHEDGREFTRTLKELEVKAATGVIQTTAAPASGGAPAAASSGTIGQIGQSLTRPEGPGAEVNETTRACVAGDDTPAGAVKDGYRKVLRQTAFGTQCFWTNAQ